MMKLLSKGMPSKKTMVWAEIMKEKLEEAGYTVEGIRKTSEGWALQLGAIVLGERTPDIDSKPVVSSGGKN